MSARVFIDLSAVFLRAKELVADRVVDYPALMAELIAAAGVPIDGDSVTAFSSVTAANEGQGKFLDFLRERLGWHVETRPARLAEIARDPQDRPIIRFDAAIAFACGLSMKPGSTVAVVSDSFALEPVLQAMAARGVRVFIGFWGSLLDPRWHSALGSGSGFTFIDFDRADRILGRRSDRTNDSFLRHLS